MADLELNREYGLSEKESNGRALLRENGADGRLINASSPLDENLL
jgi:hypothetical protein